MRAELPAATLLASALPIPSAAALAASLAASVAVAAACWSVVVTAGGTRSFRDAAAAAADLARASALFKSGDTAGAVVRLEGEVAQLRTAIERMSSQLTSGALSHDARTPVAPTVARSSEDPAAGSLEDATGSRRRRRKKLSDSAGSSGRRATFDPTDSGAGWRRALIRRFADCVADASPGSGTPPAGAIFAIGELVGRCASSHAPSPCTPPMHLACFSPAGWS
jgi:hypothetical protein